MAIFQDVDIPEVAKLVFDSCEFDAEFEQVSVSKHFDFNIKAVQIYSTKHFNCKCIC